MRYVFLFLIYFISSSFVAGAQILPLDISITITPGTPKPGDRVFARVESYGADISTSLITWRQNGRVFSSGTGKTNIEIVLPNTATQTILSASVSGVSGEGQTSISIWPSSIDVIWESVDGYTPPFYKGKALPSVGGLVRAVAIPTSLAPRSLSYQWQHDDSALLNQSGLNKTAATIKTDALSTDESFSVTVKGGGFSGEGRIAVPIRTPDIVVYKKTNGFIDYTEGFATSIPFFETGGTLVLEPFNFSVKKDPAAEILSSLSIGESIIYPEPQTTEVRITNPGTGGIGRMKVQMQNIKERAQSVLKQFIITFE